jgi:hypothetical protein
MTWWDPRPCVINGGQFHVSAFSLNKEYNDKDKGDK